MRNLIAALLILAVPASSFAAGAAGPFCPSENLMKLHGQIAAAKLDHLLNLTGDQARALLPIVKEAVVLREQLQTARANREPAVIQALTAIRDDVQKNGVASAASIKALKDARGDAQTNALHQQLKALREKAAQVLTADQRNLLKNFDPRPIAGVEGGGFGGEPEHHAGVRQGHGGRGPMHHGAMMLAISPELVPLLEARAAK